MAAEDEEFSLWGWESFFDELEVFVINCNREFGSCSYEYAEFVVGRLETCVQVVSYVNNTISRVDDESDELALLNHSVRELLTNCNSLLMIWQDLIDSMDATVVSLLPSDGYVVPMTEHGVGRPQLAISRDQLVYLRSLNFCWSSIARLLSVSRMTIYRRRQHFDIVESDIRMNMTQNELDEFNRQL